MPKRDVVVLREMLERVKVATEPDTILDRRICQALGIAPWGGTRADHIQHCMPNSKMDKATPRLTASIDAAVALFKRVLPGWSYCIRGSGFGGGDATIHDPMKAPAPGYDTRFDHPAGPCLALIGALLTALIATEDAAHG